jgi:putative transposase
MPTPLAAATSAGTPGTGALHAVGGPGPPQRWADHGAQKMYAGGMSQRDIESAREPARGPWVLSQRAVSDLTARLPPAYAACRPRDLRGDEIASLFRAAVYEPLRRWGSQTGLLWVWGLCLEGRKGGRSVSSAQSESAARGLEVLRDLGTRGRQTPGPSTPDGAPGLRKAVAALWPRSRRLRCWLHTRQHLPQKVPPPAWPAVTPWVADRREAPTVEAGEHRRGALGRRPRAGRLGDGWGGRQQAGQSLDGVP